MDKKPDEIIFEGFCILKSQNVNNVKDLYMHTLISFLLAVVDETTVAATPYDDVLCLFCYLFLKCQGFSLPILTFTSRHYVSWKCVHRCTGYCWSSMKIHILFKIPSNKYNVYFNTNILGKISSLQYI